MTEPCCPACDGPKRRLQYLCRMCWFTLPDAARQALNRRDHRAAARLRELYEQLQQAVPLVEIRITP